MGGDPPGPRLTIHTERVDQAVSDYVEAIAAEHRALFDRLYELILEVRPDAQVVISYKIPTFKVGKSRLYLGAWKHGLSIYGWGTEHDGGFAARHPELVTSKGTIQLRPSEAAEISDDELRDLIGAALT